MLMPTCFSVQTSMLRHHRTCRVGQVDLPEGFRRLWRGKGALIIATYIDGLMHFHTNSSLNSTCAPTTRQLQTDRVLTGEAVSLVSIAQGDPSLTHANIEYRSAIFYTTPEQKEIAEKVIAEAQEK